ncbi:multicopper oxidase family protein [Actinoplanes sp. NPDC049316]|uniref:multicopper oxidase family protein n=1 Tax=Actinoplanes sp. NPDC049316 TaxID=3154727 RepID=UPI00342C7839
MSDNERPPSAPLSRRKLLAAGALGAAGVIAGGLAIGHQGQARPPARPATEPLPSPSGGDAAPATAPLRAGGALRRITLTAAPATVDLAGRRAATWTYGNGATGPEIRVRRGDTLAVTVTNRLPDPTTVHWHGLAIRNASDGVPGLTQPAIAPGARYTTSFVVPDAGTYWYHSHHGVQLDRGLYGPLVVEDPDDPGADLDRVIVLDDWLDGLGATPDAVLGGLGGAPGMAGMHGAAHAGQGAVPSGLLPPAPMISSALGGLAGHIAYPLHLLNGRPPADRHTFRAGPGDRVRLRLINAGSDTAYRFAVGGHELTVTHADGWRVEPVTVPTLIIGMGERYDVTVTVRSGAWPVYAAAEGKPGGAAAVLRTTDAAVRSAPPAGTRPGELAREPLAYDRLRPAAHTTLAGRDPDREFRMFLTGSMGKAGVAGAWQLAGDTAMRVHKGERVRITVVNYSEVFHPMHLHGHTFAVAGPGTRRDTVTVLPGQALGIDFDATNPGAWMYHCHNTYHTAMGMMATLTYR